MEHIHQQIITYFASNPKALFLLDGGGALLSAFLLGVVLVEWQALVGIPTNILRFLTVFPILFAVYDAICFLVGNGKTGWLLRGIALLNVGYCVLSMIMLVVHWESITVLGMLYVGIEIFMILILVWVEWRAAFIFYKRPNLAKPVP